MKRWVAIPSYIKVLRGLGVTENPATLARTLLFCYLLLTTELKLLENFCRQTVQDLQIYGVQAFPSPARRVVASPRSVSIPEHNICVLARGAKRLTQPCKSLSINILFHCPLHLPAPSHSHSHIPVCESLHINSFSFSNLLIRSWTKTINLGPS